MKLKDLKQGMVCKVRSGESIVIVNNGVFLRRTFGIYTLEEKYNENLTHKQLNYLDIMEITYGNELVFKRNESRWFVPEYGERYYFTSSYGEITSSTNTEDKVDNEIFNIQRVFKTREEAEKRLEQQQAALSVERWIAENDVEVDVYDTNVLKCSLYYYNEAKEFGVMSSNYRIIIPKQFILSSPEKAEQLIKEREKELKIMLGVEE